MSFSKLDYKGKNPSTLCKGCGHDGITASIVNAYHELQIPPQDIIKLSGIGCSSKIPNYFMDSSFGFNSIHGRMASLATGVHLSQPKAKLLGISGDGDTASIGLSGFLHMIRRNVPIIYIIADNGVYGLTKGQFSATSKSGDTLKSKQEQVFEEINSLLLALNTGCDFVARAFSGDQVQLKSIIQAASLHSGSAVINVISPCVAYGNHEGYSKNYSLNQEIKYDLNEIDIIPDPKEALLPKLNIKNLKPDYNHHSIESALKLLQSEQTTKALHTGIIYLNKNPKENLNQRLNKSAENKFDLENFGLSDEEFSSFLNNYKI